MEKFQGVFESELELKGVLDVPTRVPSQDLGAKAELPPTRVTLRGLVAKVEELTLTNLDKALNTMREHDCRAKKNSH